MQMDTLRERVAASDRAPPPLKKSPHCCVMDGHVLVQPPDPPAGGTQPHAKLGFLACDEIVAKSACRHEGCRPNQRVAAAGARVPERGVPFYVAEHVVDRVLRMPF